MKLYKANGPFAGAYFVSSYFSSRHFLESILSLTFNFEMYFPNLLSDPPRLLIKFFNTRNQPERFQMKTQSSTFHASVKDNQLFLLSTFFLDNAKGDIYKITQAIVWFTSKGFKRISRSAIAKFAGCHVDTVSEANMRLEESGLFQIGRKFKKANVYLTEALDVLTYFFGYSVNFLLSSASLLNSTDNINIYIDLKETRFWVYNTEQNNQKGEIQETLHENSFIPSKALRNSTPVLCPDKATVQAVEDWNTDKSEEERTAFRAEVLKQFSL